MIIPRVKILNPNLLSGGDGELVLAANETAATGLAVADDGDVLGGFRETEDGHIRVDRLVVARLDRIRLVKDSDATVRANEPVEATPGEEVRLIRITCETLQVLEGAPVLDQRGPLPGEEVVDPHPDVASASQRRGLRARMTDLQRRAQAG